MSGFVVSHELNYFIISNDEMNVFGYGTTLDKAKLMLDEDLAMLKEDVAQGIVNESNTDPKKLRMLREFFS